MFYFSDNNNVIIDIFEYILLDYKLNTHSIKLKLKHEKFFRSFNFIVESEMSICIYLHDKILYKMHYDVEIFLVLIDSKISLIILILNYILKL